MTVLIELVKRYLDRYPEESHRRVAALLATDHPSLFPTVERARSRVRYVVGANSEEARGKIKRGGNLHKDTAPRPGSKIYALPKSKAKPWLPYDAVPNGGLMAIFGDCHFPKHDERAIEAAVAHVHSFGEPTVVLLNGDFADAEEFGSWAKSPKAIDTENALENVRAGLLYFRAQFPNAKLIYKLGNHEERLDRYCWGKAPELVGVPHISWQGLLTIDNDLRQVEELKEIEWVGEQRPVMAGKLPIWHGHELPKGLTNSVNPARGAFLRLIDTAVINHHHRSSSHVEYTWRHHPINCWSIGCLCDLSPEYARINKWNHGHALVESSKSGNFQMHNFKQMQNYEVVTA